MQKIPNRFLIAKKMPPLKHNPSGEFDPRKSEVVQWLIEQPEILNYLFDAIRGNGRRESPIIYNPETGEWKGVDYDGD